MRARFWLRLWAFARKRAATRVCADWPAEWEDAKRTWRASAHLKPPLNGPAWVTRGLSTDLALHDAMDHLLGKQLR